MTHLKPQEEQSLAIERDRLKLRLAKLEAENASLRNQNSTLQSDMAYVLSQRLGMAMWFAFPYKALSDLMRASARRIRHFRFRAFCSRTSAWYGRRQLSPQYFSRLFSSSDRFHGKWEIFRCNRDEVSLEGSRPLHRLLGSAEMVRACLEAAEPAATSSVGMDANFSFVTSYTGCSGEFAQCAGSVQRAIERALLAISAVQVEWVIVNDDPKTNGDNLWCLVPAALHRHVRLLSDGERKGIAARLSEAVAEAKFNWVLFLDCKDEVAETTIEVLKHYQVRFPQCRYISSTMEEIDDNGNTLRFRRHEKPATQLFEAGMVAGHLKVIRRDLIEELGGFDSSFEGAQDYDFALRTAAREPILQIPEPLYRCRQYSDAQSLAKRMYHARRERAVANSFLRGILGAPPVAPLDASPWPQDVRGLCILRTQGRRLELLASAIESVLAQRVPMTPCIVVHANSLVYDQVRDWLDQFHDVVALHAPRTDLKQGEPCNVALSFLESNIERFDFFSFLDDDDHFLPNFSERLTETARYSGADVIVGLTNAIDLNGNKLKQHSIFPISSLCSGNFIPINSYIVRSSTLPKTKVRFDTSMHYLQDWDFLLQLLGAGASFVPLYETVAEYRLIGDGNIAVKQDPQHYQECCAKVLERGHAIAEHLSPAAFWRDILDFPDEQVPWLTEGNIWHLRQTMNAFTRAGR